MLASFWGSTAQEMKITSIERAGGDVLLSYDLIDKDVSRRYQHLPRGVRRQRRLGSPGWFSGAVRGFGP